MDRLAKQYAETQDPATFDDLFRRMYPIVKLDAKRYQLSTGHLLTNELVYEDLESYLLQCVHDEALKYKDKEYPFVQMYRANAKQLVMRLMREKKAKRRDNGIRDISLTVLNEDMLYQRVQDEKIVYRIEENLIDEIETKKMLTGFVMKANEQYGKVILLINDGYTNQEIAGLLGDDQYSPRIRKTVQRAKDSFKKYLENELRKAV